MSKEELKKILYGSLSGFGSLALAILLYFLLLRFSAVKGLLSSLTGILLPFIFGSVMAYLLKTPCNKLEQILDRVLPAKQKKRAPGLAVLISILVYFLILYLLLSLVIPELISSIAALSAMLPGKINEFSNWMSKTMDGNEVLQNYLNTVVTTVGNKARTWAQQDLIPLLQGMIDGFASRISSVVGVLYNMFLGVIVCIYLLGERKHLARQGKAVLYAVFSEKHAEWILTELSFIDRTFVGFFVGKILDSAIVGVICYVFCLIMTLFMGFTNGMLISVIIGVTNIIPYFGPIIGGIPSALLILISSPMNCVIFLIFIAVLQQFDGNILGPKLLADSVGLSGLWVLFSITVFGGMFGFIGILVGVPVFAVIYDLLRRWVILGLKKKGKLAVLTGEDSHES